MPPVGFEPTISAGERPHTYVLDRAATGDRPSLMLPECIGNYLISVLRYKFLVLNTCHPDALYLREQGCEDPWLFPPSPPNGLRLRATILENIAVDFLILSFRRVLYVVRFLLGISPAPEC